MFGITLILIGIAFALNGLIAVCKWDKRGLACVNTLIGLFVVVTSIYELFTVTTTNNTLIYFGELLFGFTLLFMASDIIWGTDKKAIGWYSIMVAVCAVTLAVYFILSDLVFLGVLWAVWSLIWVFLFVGFGATGKFRLATFYCLILEGIVALMAVGFLQLMGVISII